MCRNANREISLLTRCLVFFSERVMVNKEERELWLGGERKLRIRPFRIDSANSRAGLGQTASDSHGGTPDCFRAVSQVNLGFN